MTEFKVNEKFLAVKFLRKATVNMATIPKNILGV